MNYLKQINAYWEKVKGMKGVDAHLQSYYFTCLYYANKYGPSFEVYRDDIIAGSRIALNTYYKVRDKASELGLVTFEQGTGKVTKCRFTVIILYQNCDSTPISPSQICDGEGQKQGVVSQICDHTNKHIITNIKDTTPTPAITEEAVVYSPSGNQVKLPYPSKKFKDAWHLWLLHLDENQNKRPTKTQERVVLGELLDKSGKDEALALVFIKYNLTHTWKTFCYPSQEELTRLTAKPQVVAPKMLTRSQGFDSRSLFGTLREDAA